MRSTGDSNRDSRTVCQLLCCNCDIATDDLRKEAGKFFVYQCQMEREKQLVDKKRQQENKIMEEHVYAQLWKLDLLTKEERERKEVEEKKKLVQDT